MRRPITQTGLSANVTPFWMIGGAGVEVEVDTETGHVRVTAARQRRRCRHADQSGDRETQLSGAAIMQLGFTMFEEMVFDGGQVTNASLADYKIPGIRDMPPMENELVDGRADRPARSAPRASASPAPSASRRRSPTRSTTPSACASPTLPITAEAVLRALRAARPAGRLEDE